MKIRGASPILALFLVIAFHARDLPGAVLETVTNGWSNNERTSPGRIDNLFDEGKTSQSIRSLLVRRSPLERSMARTSGSNENGWNL